MTRKKSRQRRTSKTYKCGVCFQDFENDEDLFLHLTSRLNTCNRCFYCDPKTQITNDIESHIRIEHSNFHCPDCGERFFLRTHWKEHMQEYTNLKQPWETFVLELPGMKYGEDLQSFAARLRRSSQFYDKCNNIRDRIQHFMQYNTSYKNCQVFMAGSIGKGTADSHSTDIDLILYLSDTTYTLDTCVRDVESIIERIKRHVENGDLNWARELQFERTTPYSVQFKLSVGDGPPIPVDLLPAVRLLPPNNQKKIHKDKLYGNMKRMDKIKQKFCQKCLSHVQVEFVTNVPEPLKDVIRIIKCWAKKIRKEECCRTVRSYFCELVVIDAWRGEGSPGHINIDNFTKLVFHRLCFCTSMRIVWPDVYQHHKYIPEFDGPMVLDPANPFCNVAPTRRDASSVSRRAVEVLRGPADTGIIIDIEPFHTGFEEQPSKSWKNICAVEVLRGPAETGIITDIEPFHTGFEEQPSKSCKNICAVEVLRGPAETGIIKDIEPFHTSFEEQPSKSWKNICAGICAFLIFVLVVSVTIIVIYAVYAPA